MRSFTVLFLTTSAASVLVNESIVCVDARISMDQTSEYDSEHLLHNHGIENAMNSLTTETYNDPTLNLSAGLSVLESESALIDFLVEEFHHSQVDALEKGAMRSEEVQKEGRLRKKALR